MLNFKRLKYDNLVDIFSRNDTLKDIIRSLGGISSTESLLDSVSELLRDTLQVLLGQQLIVAESTVIQACCSC